VPATAGGCHARPGTLKTMDDIAAHVSQIISTHLGIAHASVVPGASLVDDLGADSLDTVELVMAFETAFGITVPEADVEHINTVQDAIDYVEVRQV
jgi:acyl carrier protein